MAFAEYLNFNGSIGIGEVTDKNSFLKEINSESVLSHVGYSNFELCVGILFSLVKLLPTKTCPKVKDIDLNLAVSRFGLNYLVFLPT